MKIVIKIQNPEENDRRLDKIISDFYKIKELGISRNEIQNYIKNGNIIKDNSPCTENNYRVKVGDEIVVNLPEILEEKIEAKNIPLTVVYEDDDMLVINKQAGLTTHPGAGNSEFTLVNALLNMCGDKLSDIGGEFRRGIVHRLDKDTSGLMVVAKTNVAHESLAKQLEDRRLKRNYICFMWNTLRPSKGSIELNMDRSRYNRLKMEVREDGRYSLSNYEIKETYGNNSISKADFNLDTGRTHQIRLHCASMDCPLIGDKLYGGTSKHLKSIYSEDVRKFVDDFPRQALHSYKIKFYQPSTGELKSFQVPLPDDMSWLEKKLKQIN